MTAPYTITAPKLVLTDGSAGREWWLHDIPADPEALHTAALVASGDYFATLAATLEQIAAALPATSTEQYQLQDIIGQLLYLQHHYVIRVNR